MTIEYSELGPAIRQRMLERRKIGAEMQVSRELLENARVSVERIVGDRLLVHLSTFVYAERASQNRDELALDGGPASVWQHLKLALFPNGDDPFGRWLLRRWPVRRTTLRIPVTATRWAVFPEFNYQPPKQFGPVVFMDEVEWPWSEGPLT
jgi:hypothetical protein